jgi:hypothetical protein
MKNKPLSAFRMSTVGTGWRSREESRRRVLLRGNRPASTPRASLKGSKPADLPVIQQTRFRFATNLSTAKGTPFSIPEMLLAIADEVI